MGFFKLLPLLGFAALFLLASSQKLSKERMTEFFQNTDATEDDIDHLVENVNSYEFPSNKQAAMIRWVENRLENNTDIEQYITNSTAFIKSLTFAYRKNFADVGEMVKSFKTMFTNNTDMEQFLTQFVVDQELYGNDMYYAFIKCVVDLIDSLGLFATFDASQIRMFARKKSPLEKKDPTGTEAKPSKLSLRLDAAHKVLYWPKLYKNLNLSDKLSVREQIFNLLLDNAAKNNENV